MRRVTVNQCLAVLNLCLFYPYKRCGLEKTWKKLLYSSDENCVLFFWAVAGRCTCSTCMSAGTVSLCCTWACPEKALVWLVLPNIHSNRTQNSEIKVSGSLPGPNTSLHAMTSVCRRNDIQDYFWGTPRFPCEIPMPFYLFPCNILLVALQLPEGCM